MDLTDFYNLKQLFIDVEPDAVIHAAAAANTSYCQTNQKESHKINVDTSINIAGLMHGTEYSSGVRFYRHGI